MRTGVQQRLVSFFDELPPEIWLTIAGFVSDPKDQAALCVAHPRLGAVALRELSSFQGVYTDIALRLLSRPATRVFTESLFRRYAASMKTNCATNGIAVRDAIKKLNDAAKARSVRRSILVRRSLPPGSVCWRLKTKGGQVYGPCLRVDYPCGDVVHFQGDAGEERLVRKDYANGEVRHYAGEWGAERMVRAELPSGVVKRFEGGRGQERLVEESYSSGVVKLFE